MKPDHLVGKGPGIKRSLIPRVKVGLRAAQAETDPAKDAFITKAVSVLRDASKKS